MSSRFLEFPPDNPPFLRSTPLQVRGSRQLIDTLTQLCALALQLLWFYYVLSHPHSHLCILLPVATAHTHAHTHMHAHTHTHTHAHTCFRRGEWEDYCVDICQAVCVWGWHSDMEGQGAWWDTLKWLGKGRRSISIQTRYRGVGTYLCMYWTNCFWVCVLCSSVVDIDVHTWVVTTSLTPSS